MKIKSIATLAFGLLSFGAIAQQDAGFSMYFFNPLYINPGYAGSRETFSGTLTHRSQWIGMDGGPTTQSLSMHSAIPNSKIGLGLSVYNDNTGPMKNTGIDLTFAYHLKVSEKAKLSFGITGKMNDIRIGWNQINIDDNNDPSFVANSNAHWVPDASAGLYFYKPRFYAGLSATHLLQSKFGTTNATGADMAKFFRQYYATTGVVLPIGEKVDFKPSLLVKYVKAAPVVGELDAAFIFYKKLYLGVGFRADKKIKMSGMDNMVIGIVEFDITRFLRIGYSYDYYLNRNGTYNSGTHEFMLGWDISCNRTKMTSPRFF